MTDPKQELAARGLQAKKSWGQNFLRNPAVLEGIARAATAPGAPVLEIGAGLGHLTRVMLGQGAQVTALERDRDMATALRENFAEEERFTFVEGNALTYSYADFAEGKDPRPVVVGNLPYHLTSPILFRVLEVLPAFQRAVFMVQREVCDRITAAPGSKTYSALSALVQARAQVARLMLVSRGSFFPVPKVDSAVFVLSPRPDVDGASWTTRYRAVVDACFAARRKTLWNNLRAAYGEPKSQAALQRTEIDPSRRPETLSVQEFWSLADAIFPAGEPVPTAATAPNLDESSDE
jgi:16S rRNA (adenine1518-N6/adenine1519-N6)-dimethyltransferase